MEDDFIPDETEILQAEIDEQQDQIEDQQAMQEEMSAFPQPKHKDSIFSFFRHLLRLKDSSKVSNLDKRELGMLDFSVRSCQHLASLGRLMSNRAYEEFFTNKGEIIARTSMSKKGWLPELVVSQKRFSSRSVQPVKKDMSSPDHIKGKGFFSRGKDADEQQISQLTNG